MAATIRIADYSEYGPERSGFVVEQFRESWAAGPGFALPDWEEMSLPWLAGPFATPDAARAAAVAEFGPRAVEG